MALLWLPEKGECQPQVSIDIEEAFTAQILCDGIDGLVTEGLSCLKRHHKPLIEYLDGWGEELNKIPDDGPWPRSTLRAGASIAIQAYRETGFFQEVEEDVLLIGQFKAEIEGIPTAYFSSLSYDKCLKRIMDTALQDSAFNTATETDGYRQMLDIGAGCVRYFMETALAA